MPGVDLRVSASVLGFSEVLVVKTRQAAANPALSRVRFKLSTVGATPSVGRDGHIDVRDGRGHLVFVAPAALTWDARAAAAGTGAGTGPQGANRDAAAPSATKPMKVEVGGGELAVTPDAAMLRDPATVFPLYVDPSFSAYKADNAWTTVWSKYPDSRFWQNDHTSDDGTDPYKGAAKVGRVRDCDGCSDYIIRTFFQMNTAPVNGRHILDAKFQITQKWSWFCDHTTTAGSRKAGLWLTGPIAPDTTWNHQPAWMDQLGTTDAAHAYGSANGCAPPGPIEFNVTSAVQRAAAGYWSDLTVGMRGLSESDVTYWKRYDPNPAIAITYNSYPNMPDALSTAGLGCATGAGRPYVTTTTPSFAARATDPDVDQQSLTETFYWWPLGGQRNNTDRLVVSPVSNPGPVSATVPAGRLTDGGTYVWQAVTNDPYDTGQLSAQCEFTVDATRPNPPAAVASTDYPSDGAFHGEVGRAGTFQIAPPATGLADVASYLCSLGLNPRPEDGVTVPSSAADHSGQVTLTPTVDGRNLLRVWAKDKAGNLSDPAHPVEYAFLVHAGSSVPAARWAFDEVGSTAGVDGTAHGNDVTISGGAAQSPGRSNVGGALTMNGTSAFAATAGPLTTRDPVTDQMTTVRTDANFSVTGWVKLSATGGAWQTVVSQSGARSKAYVLGYSGVYNRWWFSMTGADTDNPAVAAVLSDVTAQAGVWTHIAGVYDAPSRALRLYVNGAPQSATATLAGGFNAGGPVLIGRGQWNGAADGYLNGTVDEVRVYARVVTADELVPLVKPVPPAISLAQGPFYAGKPVTVNLSAGGDTNVTAYRYSIGSASVDTVATPASPGAPVSVTVVPAEDGDVLFAAVAVDAANRRSDTAGRYLSVLPAPRLSGIVTDAATGLPVSGATVRLSPGSLTTTTGADGSYSFTGINARWYTVTATSGSRCAGLLATTQTDVTGPTVVDLAMSTPADAFGYTCDAVPRAFIPADTTVLPLTGDDAWVQMNLPFPVPFYGQSYTSVWVSTNGLISFTASAYDSLSAPIPTYGGPDGYLAPFRDDLVVDSAASVRTTVVGSAPNPQLVVEWRNVGLYADATKRLSFETVLGEDGTVWFDYAGVDDATEAGSHAGVGIESPRGQVGLQYSFREPALVNGTAVVLRYPATPHAIENSTVSGTVIRAADGTPVPGIPVHLDPYNISTVTAADGSYSFSSLQTGGYALRASAANGCGPMGQADVMVDGTTSFDLPLQPTFDGAGYSCTVADGVPFVPADTTVLDMSSSPVKVDLPFSFPFYGTAVSALWVYPTGGAYLNPISSNCGSGTWGRVHLCAGGISPLWGGTSMDSYSSVRTTVTGSAPNRTFIIEWRQLELSFLNANRVTFEAMIREDGTITFNYASMPTSSDWLLDTGIRSPSGDVSLLYATDTGELTVGRAITFRPPLP